MWANILTFHLLHEERDYKITHLLLPFELILLSYLFQCVHPFLARLLELPETCEESFAAYFTLFLESFEAD